MKYFNYPYFILQSDFNFFSLYLHLYHVKCILTELITSGNCMRLRLLSAYSVVMLHHEVGLAASSRLAVETGALDSCLPRCGLFLVV